VANGVEVKRSFWVRREAGVFGVVDVVVVIVAAAVGGGDGSMLLMLLSSALLAALEVGAEGTKVTTEQYGAGSFLPLLLIVLALGGAGS